MCCYHSGKVDAAASWCLLYFCMRTSYQALPQVPLEKTWLTLRLWSSLAAISFSCCIFIPLQNILAPFLPSLRTGMLLITLGKEIFTLTCGDAILNMVDGIQRNSFCSASTLLTLRSFRRLCSLWTQSSSLQYC